MSLTIKAATAMHFAGVAYAAGDTIDTTGMNDRSIAVLLKHQPVYVSAASSATGVPFLKAFPFAWDTPGIATGHDTGYSPAVGDILLDAWIDVLEAWDGTTPKADIAMFVGADSYSQTTGLFKGTTNVAGCDLTSQTLSTTGYDPTNWATPISGANKSLVVLGGHDGAAYVPARIEESHPLKIVANQTASPAGAAAGSTVGSAVFYMLWVTPPS